MGIREEISDKYDDILFADGFDKACIGVVSSPSVNVACYDSEMCLEVLVDSGMSYEDAVDYFYYNVAGASAGEKTPVFLDRFGNGMLNIYEKEECGKDN